MVTYDDLVMALEDAWLSVGLHEHALVESVIPATHDRTCKIELFPEHAESLMLATMPPWLELNFTWSPVHQLISEGRDLPADPLELTLTYTVTLVNHRDRSDIELVRMFQRAVRSAFERLFPADLMEMESVSVEVRRIYQPVGQKVELEVVQLVSSTMVDLFEQWEDRDVQSLRQLLRSEMNLARTIIANLSDTFHPHGNGGYRSVDAA
ncbi:hypothetical protein [Chloroflexus sp.]|uniref:hypothetical protein n=1 Tax=Chloroflexus sp. TaxID=1904827 RepID=UPI0040496AA1